VIPGARQPGEHAHSIAAVCAIWHSAIGADGDSVQAMRHRRSIRLPDFDYRDQGAYFVTICTVERAELFGSVVHGAMQLNAIGRLVAQVWARYANQGCVSQPYDLVVMPNHIHGIIWLAGTPVGARRPPVQDVVPFSASIPERTGVPKLADVSPLQPPGSAGTNGFPARSLASRIAAFKIASRNAVNRLSGTPGAPIWQRNYDERIVRNEDELIRIRQYILDNPAKWPDDPNDPTIWR
jgi:putative transposase